MAAELKVVGIAEIARLLEVKPRTPHAWSYRQILPPPDYDKVNGTSAWDRATILRWALRTDRCPEHLKEEAVKALPKAERERLAGVLS